uniref:WD_REPEATS_REGION domain-containing protein n=1 Tax=Caenorhabditis tropicalis TaxID=1561998 RepID=A0A1I7U479_9PELO
MSEDECLVEIPREQRVWKKNAPYLYDTVVTRMLDWPTLTVQWMPDVTKTENSDASIHRMLLGTHTSGDEQNYLMISKFVINTDAMEFDDSKWDHDRQEYGGYGAGSQAKLDTEIRINHSGEVHRARYMPQNPIVIASRGPNDDVYVFDYTKHPSQPHDSKFRPDLRLIGHEGEGYGISWSTTREGNLLTAGDDGMICHWDINQNQKVAGQLHPVFMFKGHSSNVEDVAFHTLHETIFASVGDDRKLNIWDIREPKARLTAIGHSAAVNCVAFNPFSEFLMATGSMDKTVALWDIRNLKQKMYTLIHHEDEVFQVEFNPNFETILASSGSDGRVIIWDISKIEDPSATSSPKSASPPPEVLFVHAGHAGKVADFSWNSNRPWTMCSSDEFNKLQIWEVSESIVGTDGEEPN